MALIDVKCLAETCGTVSEVVRPASAWPTTPPCPTCGAPTEQAHFPKRTTWTVDPVVVFEAPDGTVRFPGEADGRSARRYAQLGYTRREIRGAAEMRTFERQMNAKEFSTASRRIERLHQMRDQRERHTRSDLYRAMQSMSNAGRDVARAMIARTNAKPQPRAGEPGFYSEVYSSDRSNREPSRDAQGRRRRE